MGLFGRSRWRRASDRAAAAEGADGARAESESANGRDRPGAIASPDDGEANGAGNGEQSHKSDAPLSTPAFLTPTALREAVHELFARRPGREEFAQQALQLMARVGSIKAAALLRHEARENLLQPVATLGLEADALELLGGDGHVQPWDIPLRVLANRRISVIQSAHENPFVPRPLVAISPRRLAIAVIPFYHAQAPVGVLVLFSPTHRGLADSALHAVSNALRVCAAALTQLPSETVVSQPLEEAQQPTLLRGLKVLKAQLAQLQKALDEAERARAAEAAERVTAESFLRAERERLAALEQELAATRAERDQIPELQKHIIELNEQLGQVAEAAEAAQAEVTRLQSALGAEEERVKEQLTLAAALESTEEELRRRLRETQERAEERTQAVRELEARVAELRGSTKQADELQDTLAETEAARAGATRELARLRDQLSAAESAHAKTRSELERAVAERHALEAQLGAARAQAEHLGGQGAAVAELRQQAQALEATCAELRQALRQHEAAEQEWSVRMATLSGERDRLAAEIERLREQSGATATELHERIEDVERERRAMRERLEALAGAEAERTAAQVRGEELQHDLLAAQESLRAQETRVRDLSEQSARLIAERRELHARIEALAAGGQTREQQKQAAINAAQRRVTELEGDLSRLSAQLDATRTAGLEELNQARAAAAKELHAVQAEVARAIRDREALERELAQREELLDAARRESAAMSSDGDRLRAEIERLNREHAAAVAECTTLLQAQAQRDERLTALEKELRAAQAAKEAAAAELNEQVATLTDRLNALEKERLAERERLLQALADKELLLQAAEEGLPSEVSDADADVESMLAIDRSGEPADEAELAADADSDGAALADSAEAAVETEALLILDSGEGVSDLAQRLGELGQLATAMAPDASVATHINGRRFAHAAINLSAPAAWQSIRSLRQAGAQPDLSFIAYALPAEAANGFWLGAVDFMVLPFADGCLPRVLGRIAPRVRRVIAMSNDIDVMSDVRAQLSGRGISTAVVLDGRQALDLVPTVRPEAAILHLSPRCTDVFRAVAGLRSNEASKSIPILFLLDSTEQAQEEAFFAAGLRMLTARGNFKGSDLVSSLATTLDSVRAAGALLQQPPPPRDRQTAAARLSL
jgi:CheY-like chemotaxis protein